MTGSIPYTVGGSVSGLTGSGLVLQNNGGNNLPVATDGSFTFTTTLVAGNSFNVSVLSQPSKPTQTCTPSQAIGTVGISDVTSVVVTCVDKVATTDKIGGTVVGLLGAGLILQNDGGDNLAIGNDGTFTFPTPLSAGSPYLVTVLSPPTGPNQNCVISQGSGTAAAADINNVAVACSSSTAATFSIGGSVTGIPAGAMLLLKDNGGDPLTLDADGPFTFATPVPSGNAYSVTFSTTSAASLSCSINNPSGVVKNAAVTNVTIACIPQASLAVNVSGLMGTGLVLQTDAGDTLAISANGAATFPTALGAGAQYTVSVLSQPVGPAQTCTVTNPSGTLGSSPAPAVNCVAVAMATVGGAVSGLIDTVVLQNNGGDNLGITANGAFTFATALTAGSAYSVTVLTQPANQECSVANGTGAVANSAITNVAVACVTVFRISGTLTNVIGSGLVLTDNGGDTLSIAANATAFVFPTPVLYNGSYLVTAASQPLGETCSVTNGTGAGVVANVTNVGVVCSVNSYTIGGTITGLDSGDQITLADNGSDSLIVTDGANFPGTFTFRTPIAVHGSYSVTVSVLPAGKVCSVSSGTGAGVNANVNSVKVVCSTRVYTVSGTITGLTTGGQVTLDDNGGDPLTVKSSGQSTPFIFAGKVPYDGSYSVTVGTQPVSQLCGVSNGSGAGVTANITSVVITCGTLTYPISGSVSGLNEGDQVTLENNAADPVTVSAGGNGTFTFDVQVPYNGSYVVSVSTPPVDETCSVNNGTGSGVTAPVTNVAVACATKTYTIGGRIQGLSNGLQITLKDNGTDYLNVGGNGSFQFNGRVAYDGSYAVIVSTQPTGEICSVNKGTGSGVTASVNNITIVCSVDYYNIGGTVSGLARGDQVTLDINGGDPLTISSDISGSTPLWTDEIAYGGSYNVTVGTQPTGKVCTVVNGNGSNVTAAVTNVMVECAVAKFHIGGNLSGLNTGVQVTLNDNGADADTLTTGGGFTFQTPIAYGASYNVTVGTQPSGELCSVANGAGTNVTTDVMNVQVSCSNAYTIGGAYSGLVSGLAFALTNSDNSDVVTVNEAGAGDFTFSQPVLAGGSYSVTVSSQPSGETCYVQNGAGSGLAADVTNIYVTCLDNIGGTVNGLAAGETLILGLSDASQQTVATAQVVGVAGSGVAFSFGGALSDGGPYYVGVMNGPANGEQCSVTSPSGGQGTASTASGNEIVVYCGFPLSVQLSGLGNTDYVALSYVSSGGPSGTAHADNAHNPFVVGYFEPGLYVQVNITGASSIASCTFPNMVVSESGLMQNSAVTFPISCTYPIQ